MTDISVTGGSGTWGGSECEGGCDVACVLSLAAGGGGGTEHTAESRYEGYNIMSPCLPSYML